MGEHSKESIVQDDTEKKKDADVIEIIDSDENVDNEQEDLTEDGAATLQKEIEELKQEKEAAQERMLRIQAEFDNFKKRTQKERQNERKYKSQDLVNELLPVLDNFERALEVEVVEEAKSIVEGISMVYRQFKDALESENVEVIQTVGEEFDPNLHHAVMQVEEEESESNIVLEELQKGYILNDRVIRPAMVKVNK
ncbi:MAG TPA: nucleotide exchange factor GrpE [Virgibacillus sp.]|nr:nucleotide exchange factor GrpE [Virgibacillus sp.]